MHIPLIALAIFMFLPLQALSHSTSSSLASASGAAQERPPNFKVVPYSNPQLLAAAASGRLELDFDGRPAILLLRPSQPPYIDSAGVPGPSDIASSGFYEGEAEGFDSTVRLTIRPDLVRGFVRLPWGMFIIEPASERVAPNGSRFKYVILNLQDFQVSDDMCGVTAAFIAANPAPPDTAETYAVSPVTGAAPRTVTMNLSIDADYEYYTRYGSEQAALDNMMSTIYELNGLFAFEKNTVTFKLASYKIWTDQNPPYPYTSSDGLTLLQQTSSFFESQRPRPQFPRQLGLLFSGKKWSGVAIGMAYLGTAFQRGNLPLQYAAVTTTGNAPFSIVVAHELGHALSAVHVCPEGKACPQCSNGGTIMCATAGPKSTGAFGAPSQCKLDTYLSRFAP